MTMFAQITTMHPNPDQLDEFAGLYEEHILPLTQAQMGYRGMYVLANRGTGKILAVTLWDREEDAAANERSAGYREQLSQLAAYLTATPDGECYEVRVDA